MRRMQTASRRTGRSSLAVLTALILAAGLAAQPALAQDKSDWPQRLTFASGPTGGFGYTMSSPWVATVGTALGVSISPETTLGVPISLQMVQAGQADLAVSTTDIVVLGWRGDTMFDGRELRDVRTLLMFDPNVFQLYADARSDIRSLSDLNGKVVNPSRAGSGSDVIMRGILDALGIEVREIVNVNPAQANELMADGRIDASVGTGNVPHPAPLQYEARSQIRLIGFTEEEVEKYLADNPQLARMVVPAGTYEGQEQDVISVGSYIMYIVHKDLPESMIYEMVKATFENLDDLSSAYKPYSRLTRENILTSPIPLHHGAVKYFEEQGMQIPDELKG